MIILLLVAGVVAYKLFMPTPVERAANNLKFDSSVTEGEKKSIRQAIQNQGKTYDGDVGVSVQTDFLADNAANILSAYVPVANLYSARQSLSKADLTGVDVYLSENIDSKIKAAIVETLGVSSTKALTGELPENAVAFVPASEISPEVKLLAFEGGYYLDSFDKGAVFRQAEFNGSGASGLAGLDVNNLTGKDQTLKVNQTGVTALTRRMMTKLNSVGNATYFSEKIGPFLADADITHVSNEVSFKPGCEYNNAVFCSPPEMIEALKASGVDLVELTGNHNNDTGRQFNTDSINQYHGLGWATFGGGLNTAEAAKPFLTDQKGSKVAFLAYNYPDSPNGGAISTASAAGANSFDFDRIKSDIESARNQGYNFVIVDVQFWECYAYPEGYVEYPICDRPIPNQEEVFRRIVDLGGDMVVGTSAHQPQTWEVYKGKPIYYGLGNLYFDQTQWPGTERGIILTHYFVGGKLLQTKLSPTVYDKAFQTHLMSDSEAVELLDRLNAARP